MSPRCLSQLRLAFVIVLLSFIPRMVRADGVQEARLAFERGVAASRAQRWSEARAEFRRSLQLMPKPSTMFNLAVADVKLGLGREALEQLDAFERAASGDEHAAMLERARVLRPQAQALLQSEQAKEQTGGNALSQSQSDFNEETRREVERARTLYESGRDKEALAAFEQAYKRSKHPGLLYDIGVVADRMRNDTRAIRAYEAFIAARPDAPEAAVAQVRSEALREALLARENDAEDRAEAGVGSRSGATMRANADGGAPSLTAPRALIVTGAALVASAGGTLAWFLERDGAIGKCDERGGCVNVGVIERQRSGALASTIVAASVGVALTTAGAVLLGKRKQLAAVGGGALAPWLAPRAFGLGFARQF